MANMKQIIYTISLILLSGACTDEKYTDRLSPEGDNPGELVPVELVLNTQPMQSALSSRTKAGGDILSSTQVCQGMEISLVETPVTRALANEVKNFWVFQFDGTESASRLRHKHFFTGSSVKDIELLSSTVKNRIIVVANTAAETFNSILSLEDVVGGGTPTTLADFNKQGISYKTMPGDLINTNFPLFHATGIVKRLYFSGSADIVVSANKQADILLYRSVAKVKVNLSLSSEMANKGYTVWTYQFMKIPEKSFYHSVGRIADFPGETVNYVDYTQTPTTLPVEIDDHLPVNLLHPVPFTTPEMRVSNAPLNATYLQLVGMQMSGQIIVKSVVYQIHMGSNFTDDYSVSPNLSYSYDIRITGESDFDSRVVKFIPGYFGGNLTMYKNDQIASSSSDADTWRFEKRIEVYLTDVNTPGGIKWLESGNLPGLNSFMDGRQNTWDLRSQTNYPALQRCIGLNGTPAPATEDAMVWYMPSYGQSLGIYIAGSNTLKTLPNTYYWSSTANSSSAWGTRIWTGESSLQEPEELYNLRCIKDLDQTNTVQ